MRIISVGLTHPGLKRELNEDSFLINEDAGLFIIADGMGGHNAGEIASQMAVEHASKVILEVATNIDFNSEFQVDSKKIKSTLIQAFVKANAEVYNAAMDNPDQEGMGTTLIIAWVFGDRCFVGHVGDVRGYLFRDGELKQLTRDHTTITAMVERGHISSEEAKNHPFRHRLENAVGADPDVEADITSFDLKQGDRILLCSDGLWDMVGNSAIGSVLSSRMDINETCQNFLDRAIDEGGKDNITLIIVKSV